MRFFFGEYVEEDMDVPGGPKIWRPPGGAHSSIDLGVPGVHRFGLFAGDIVPAGVTDLGDDPVGQLRVPQLTAIRAALGITETLNSATLGDVFWEIMTGAIPDPTGTTRWKGLRPRTDRQMNLWLGGIKLKTQRVEIDDPELGAGIVAGLQADYRKLRQESDAGLITKDQHRRWLSWQMDKWRIGNHEILIPAGETIVDPLPHSTSVSDDFNRSDESLDASGWTEVRADTDVVSNQAASQSTDVGINCFNTDLSGEDHFCQLDFVSASNSNQFCGPTVRATTSAQTAYYNAVTIGGTKSINKVVSGSFNTISSGSAGHSGAGHTYKVVISGSDLELFEDGGSILTGSDTDITGNLKFGELNRGLIADEIWDNWSAGDNPAGGVPHNPLGHPLVGPFGGPIG
jgi:hypothetical protein